MAFADEFMKHTRADPESFEVLQSLHKNHKLRLVSNFGIPECSHRLLEKLDLKKFFNAIVISAEINQRKPSPNILKKALSILDVDASRAVFVGGMADLDVICPKRVGIKTILIERKPPKDVYLIKPDWIIRSLRELLFLLQ